MLLLIALPGPQVGETRITGILQDERLGAVAHDHPFAAFDFQAGHTGLLLRTDPCAQRGAAAPVARKFSLRNAAVRCAGTSLGARRWHAWAGRLVRLRPGGGRGASCFAGRDGAEGAASDRTEPSAASVGEARVNATTSTKARKGPRLQWGR